MSCYYFTQLSIFLKQKHLEKGEEISKYLFAFSVII